MTTDPKRILVFAPNWLGDAVVAVPCVEAIRRHYPSATLAVAARTHLAALYEMAAGVDEVLCLERAGRFGGWLAALRDARKLREARFDVAILLPNSFRSAWIARRAGIAERWGYATDGRTTMLTRAVARVHGVHQVEYYQRLLEGLDISGAGSGRQPGTSAAAGTRDLPSVHLDVPAGACDWARRVLMAAGWKPGEPLVGMAPGAAYGGAKQWPPERFAQLALELAQAPPWVRTVLVGSAGDRAACDEIARVAAAAPTPRSGERGGVVNLCGRTDLRQLAAVIAECRTFVSNDSGAMHLAAAVGVPVVAIFGSTNEKETAPLPTWPGTGDQRSGIGAEHAIVAIDIACRPCMLRECPLDDHPCMTGIDVARVKLEVLKRVGEVDSGQ